MNPFMLAANAALVVVVAGCASAIPAPQHTQPPVVSAPPPTQPALAGPVGGPPWTTIQADACDAMFHASQSASDPVWDITNFFIAGPPRPGPGLVEYRDRIAHDAQRLAAFERLDVVSPATWQRFHDAAARAAALFAAPMTPQSFVDEFVPLLAAVKDASSECDAVSAWVYENVPR